MYIITNCRHIHDVLGCVCYNEMSVERERERERERDRERERELV